MKVPFEKYHGTGNDFLIVDADRCVPDRGALAARECDREAGVGADGVLFLALEPDFRPPRVVMTLVQPDGGTAPMCGNGARCAAAWAMERTDDDAVMIDTQAGTRRAERVDGGIAVEMGAPTFDPDRVPVRAGGPVVREDVAGLEVTAVNTGVPHAVAFVEDVDAVDLDAVAEPVRHADAFPRGTNVVLANPAGDGFRQRTYERGVEAETASCGTGAVAVAAVARRLGLTDRDEVPVTPPGGELRVRFDGADPRRGAVAAGRGSSADTGEAAVLIGPVEREFAGEVGVADPEPVVEP